MSVLLHPKKSNQRKAAHHVNLHYLAVRILKWREQRGGHKYFSCGMLDGSCHFKTWWKGMGAASEKRAQSALEKTTNKRSQTKKEKVLALLWPFFMLKLANAFSFH